MDKASTERREWLLQIAAFAVPFVARPDKAGMEGGQEGGLGTPGCMGIVRTGWGWRRRSERVPYYGGVARPERVGGSLR